MDAFNVTHPYKQAIFPYLDKISKIAKATQAVNTVIKENNQIVGYNTDYDGFKALMEYHKVNITGKHIAIVGHGATSKTVAYYLNQHDPASIIHFVRHVRHDHDRLLSEQNQYQHIDIIINTTPVGMFPHTFDEPLIQFDYFPNCQVAIDVIYHPYRTSFLIEAEKHKIQTINGLYMLVMQAVKTQELIQRKTFSQDIVKTIYQNCLLNQLNFVFIGLPLSGKTRIGKQLSKHLKWNFYDTDQMIIKHTKQTIPYIFQTQGETSFRKIETKMIQSLDSVRQSVISTGGGIVLDSHNIDYLKHHGIIIYINRHLDDITYRNDHQRPLIQTKADLLQLQNKRQHLYQTSADIEYLIDKNHPHSIERLMDIINDYFNY